MANPDSEENLLQLLLALHRGDVMGAHATARLRDCVLAIGSASPDNINCANHIEVGLVRREFARPAPIRCINIKKRNIMLAEVINVLEDAPIPEVVRQEFPGLTIADWRACLRLVTILLTCADHIESSGNSPE
ncbi:hypothetical protein [Polyangium sp. 15x6]|uniref:hypothetical protein n=1 Tax=Polyangium sp. 15x6 TaxID=3042687 RepID=UPI002499FC52|nr:hypothetical protein [Polyangium sp. 15x6]MDI3292191.1 hypothetical protein [Polyangium sp. 15x6]